MNIREHTQQENSRRKTVINYACNYFTVYDCMTGIESERRPMSGEAREMQCPICRKTFQSIAEMQKHLTIEHMQKGEIPAYDNGGGQ